MAKIMENIVGTSEISVTTYNWERFGNNVNNPIDALCEYIHNGYAAGLRAAQRNGCDDLIVDVSFKNGTLYVKNTGVIADLQKVVNYGDLNHDTPLNQFGTGFKTATSYMNPSNTNWAFYTHDESKVLRISGPYGQTMKIEELSAWPFEEKYVSCIVVPVDSQETRDLFANTNKMVKELGYHYSLALRKGFNLRYNNVSVTPVLPIGQWNSDVAILNIRGEDVQCEYTLCVLSDDVDKAAEYFPASTSGQGVYIYVNNCLAIHASTTVLLKQGGGSLETHNSMNRCVALVNILIPSNQRHLDVPFVNSKNAIDWTKQNGKDYKKEISHLCKPFFSKYYSEYLEKKERDIFEPFVRSIVDVTDSEYVKEFRVSATGGKGRSGAYVDGAVVKKATNGKHRREDVTMLIEYKAHPIKHKDVSQIVGYVYHFCDIYPDVKDWPKLIIAGPDISDDGKAALKGAQLTGIKIEYKKWAPHCLL